VWLLTKKLSPYAPALLKSFGDGLTSVAAFEAMGSVGGISELLRLLPSSVHPNLVTDHIIGAGAWGASYALLATSLSDKISHGQGDESAALSVLGFIPDNNSLRTRIGSKASYAPPAVAPKPAYLPPPPPGVDVILVNEGRAQALRDRSKFLRNMWYAAAIAFDVTSEKPKAVTVLGMQLVLIRDAATGKVHCLQDACPHRGAPLSTGWTTRLPDGGTALVCGYHGWQFDGDGRLRAVPANSNNETLPQRPLIETFPVREQAGFVWLFYGDSALPEDVRPPVPSIPEFDERSGWVASYGEFTFSAPHQAVFENAIDFAHIHFLHSSSFGNKEAPQVRNMTATADAFGVHASFDIQNKPVNALWEFTRVPEVHIDAKALMPCTSVVGFTLARGISMITFVNTVPIDDTTSVNRFALVRNFATTPALGPLLWLADRIAVRAMHGIMNEDRGMVDTLRPELVTQEVNVRADLVQLEYRKLRAQWLSLGYGVDPPNVALRDSAAARASCAAGCQLPEA